MTRLINAALFSALYLVFLAWYNGWGSSPLTPAELEQYLANVPANTEGVEFVERMRQLAADDDGEQLFMLNLNRYRYAEGEPSEGVPAAYQTYGRSVIIMLLRNAGHPIYSGNFQSHLLDGDASADDWDEIILVRYRSRRDFISMVTSQEYQQIAPSRGLGIEYAEVTPTFATINLAMPRLLVLILLLLPALLVDSWLRKRAS